MSNSKTKSTTTWLDTVLNYVDSSKGLRAKVSDSGRVEIYQDVDNKHFRFLANDIQEVLHRTDSEGKTFLQVNFMNSTKVLLTDTLIGFKPIESVGLDMSRIPKVVTTPDLKSVFEAIEEALGGDNGADHELEILKKVYFSIMTGAENVGFDLDFEKKWYNRLAASRLMASA